MTPGLAAFGVEVVSEYRPTWNVDHQLTICSSRVIDQPMLSPCQSKSLVMAQFNRPHHFQLVDDGSRIVSETSTSNNGVCLKIWVSGSFKVIENDIILSSTVIRSCSHRYALDYM